MAATNLFGWLRDVYSHKKVLRARDSMSIDTVKR